MPFDNKNFVADFVQQPEIEKAPSMSLQLLLDGRNMIANQSEWTHGAYVSCDDRRFGGFKRCAVGALREALSRRSGAMNTDCINAIAVLKATIDIKYGRKFRDVEHYNDTHSHREVMKIFDLSIARQLGAENAV